MKKGVIVIVIAVCLLLAIRFLPGGEQENLELPDMGGVYSVSLNNLDFSTEITGMLSDGVIDEVPYEEYEDVFAEALPVSGYSNKVLRWGIARRGYDKIPDADPGAPELLAKYGGVYLGDTSKKVIYLTFDEGYENGYTPKILDVLRDNNVKAVFFITGPYLNEHQDLVRRMVEEGHVVGNHTVHHPVFPAFRIKNLRRKSWGLTEPFMKNSVST
ncbi:polysaccharide deacetylase [Acetivibrio straminisolvens JCM 21531]|uniref:Polysaccharide deacetylase n=1 Tax=Acetivibrio straminisolvens JCM 21531 TaxID=1294263 RepID=W4V4J0_9FIRM|nr:polysaccharide deacetylase [Acetivibrio straminisolvens JCM 21531]